MHRKIDLAGEESLLQFAGKNPLVVKPRFGGAEFTELEVGPLVADRLDDSNRALDSFFGECIPDHVGLGQCQVASPRS